MQIENIFVSVNARDFEGLSRWYVKLLERAWDNEPQPSCHEWELTGSVLFQVLDSADDVGKAVVTIRTTKLDGHVDRLRSAGVEIPDPVDVDGFDTLRFAQFADPEGNTVGLLEGK